MRWSADAMRGLAVVTLCVALVGCGQAPETPTAPVGRSAPPSAVTTPPPEYPEALACNGVGGRVDLRIRIEADGSVRESEIQKSSGNADLDAAARKAVTTWTFNPALQAGKPVAQWISVPMTFHVPQPRPERCYALDEQATDALKKP